MILDVGPQESLLLALRNAVKGLELNKQACPAPRTLSAGSLRHQRQGEKVRAKLEHALLVDCKSQGDNLGTKALHSLNFIMQYYWYFHMLENKKGFKMFVITENKVTKNLKSQQVYFYIIKHCVFIK